jgi:hypothetical protein
VGLEFDRLEERKFQFFIWRKLRGASLGKLRNQVWICLRFAMPIKDSPGNIKKEIQMKGVGWRNQCGNPKHIESIES